MTKIKETRFEYSEKQGDFLFSDARFVFFVGGIGSGKTAVGAVKAVTKILEGKSGLIISPDYPHFIRSTWPEFSKWCPWSAVTYHNKTEKRMEFDTGAVVWYGGIDDPDSFRGPNVNWFFFDEGARKRDRKAFDVLAGRIRIGDKPQGWVTTTPAGRRHWLYDVAVKQDFSKAQENGQEMVKLVHASTIENSPNLDPMYYTSLQASYSGRFLQQELEGMFVDVGVGMVYEEFGPENITTDADYDESRGPVEWAYDDGISQNPRVILFIQRDDDGTAYVFDELVHLKHLAEMCIGEALDRGYSHPDIAIGDPSAVDMKMRLRQADIVARTMKSDVKEGIKLVRRIIRDGNGQCHMKVHPRCESFIREFGEDYRYPASGSISVADKPVKEDDHTADAFRYWASMRMKR